MVATRIRKACSLAGMKLTEACKTAGVSYNTLYNQIRFNREIPFSTVEKFASGLGLPINFFKTGELEASVNPPLEESWAAAASINAERATTCRAGFHVTTDHILDWFHQEGGQLRNWSWFEDQVDLYHPVFGTDSLMKPIKMGKRSITTERLMLSSESDLLEIVSHLKKEKIDRAMWAHKILDEVPYIVSDETLDAVIKGTRVCGGYRKISMRVTGPNKEPINAVFSNLTWLRSK